MTAREPAAASLLDLLDASVSRCAARPLFAVKTEGRWVETSYAEFAKLVDDARDHLVSLGVKAGDRVGIIAGNCIEWAALAYASYGLRAAIVPMYESQLEAEWEFVLRDAEIRALFVADATILAKMAALRRTIPTLSHVCPLRGPDEPGGRSPAPSIRRASLERPGWEDVAAILYTSGTTGEPKGVVLTHGNIVSNVSTVRRLVPVSERHRTLCFLPWAHAFGHTLELHGVIAAGASMALVESVDKIVDNLREVRPTVLIAVPRVFLRVYARVNEQLANKPRAVRWLSRRGLELARRRSAGARLSLAEHVIWRAADRLVFSKVRERVGGRLEFAVSGAAALPKEVAELVDGLGIEVFEGYGLTETAPVVAANVPGQRKLTSVGRPLPGVRVVIDERVGDWSRGGEIIVYGPNVMRGYHNRVAETRAVFTEDGGLRTGDVGYLDEDGYLYITGRIKEQYKLSNGRFVSPAPLEERLKLSPFIAEVMIHGEGRDHNVALVVPEWNALSAWLGRPSPGEPEACEELTRDPRARQKIASEIESRSKDFRRYERIVAFSLLSQGFTQENGLLTPSLKLKRRQIVARWQEEIDRLYLGAPEAGAFDPN